MSTIADYPQTRPVPRKLGPAKRLSGNARASYWQQVDFETSEGRLDVRTADFLKDVTHAYSNPAAVDFYPSQATMAEHRQCSRRTIQRRIERAKSAGVLLVAQLKGYDAKAGAWFCSSNTHRIAETPQWKAKKAERAAAKAKARHELAVAGRATPSRPNRRDEGETRPAVPDVDLDAIRQRESEAVPVSEVRSHTDRLRDVIMPRPHPPPSS